MASLYPRDQGLSALFAAQAEAHGDAIAVSQGAERVTYEELDRRANQLAHALRAVGVGEETPVGVYMGQRIEQIVAQVAICKAGGSYVPLDPEYPRERLEFMLRDAGVGVVIADSATEGRPLSGERLRICVDRDRETLAGRPEGFDPLPGGASRRTHILYTSGSTGTPKGIEVVARAISRLVLNTNYVHIEPGDRVAQLSNFSFDAAIFEVWGPLLNGGRVVLLDKSSILDPHVFRATLRRERISIMFLTTALFNFTAQECPDAFAGLKTLMVGGERANPQTMRAVLEQGPPRHFMHAYGPTESTTFTTMHPLSLAEVAGATVAIGGPISNTTVKILDAQRRPVAVDEPGEIYVGGDGLARGYLNRPELTAERFVTVGGQRLYRTGDLARWRADGAIEFLGRLDFQVKIRGHRIEIEEVEAALLASGSLRGAVIAVREDASGDKSMVAHVVAREPGTLDLAALKAELQAKLPAYMVPARFVEQGSLPLTANGKLDRKALGDLVTVREPAPATAPEGVDADPLAAEITAIWARLLGVAELGPDDDFFRLGGSSLLAARLVMRVREVFRVDFPVYSLYESATLGRFIEVVRAAQRGAATACPEAGPATWKADAQLPADIQYAAGVGEQGGLAAAREVLLTGATGFLGAFLLRDLLTHTQARVSCLVRAGSRAEGLERIKATLRKYGLWEEGFAARVRAVPGDLRETRLGLTPRVWALLAEQIDTIFHCGAQVSYVQPYSAHRATNVEGTLELLRLAGQERVKPLHHVSSIAVFGPTGYFTMQRRIDEDEPLDDHLEHLRYDIGYSASKWVAEKLVWEASARGLPVSVYRPGFIMGHSRSGIGNCEDFMARSIKGCIQLGACPDLPAQRKEFVPVDFVSAGIVRIAAKAGASGKAYHLVPPKAEESLDMNGFFALLARCGHPLTVLSYGEWVQRLMQDPQVERNALCPLIPMLFERVYRDLATRWELYEDMPEFAATRASALLADSEVAFHRMDRALLTRYLAFWERAGFIDPPAQAATG